MDGMNAAGSILDRLVKI